MKYEQDRLDAVQQVRDQLKPVLGPSLSSRVKAYQDGTLFVEATLSSAFLAWLVDSILVNGTAVGLGALYYVRSYDPNKDTGAFVIGFTLLFVLPLLYGWFYANGRGVGALLTGTQLVRLKDGSRVGLAKAGWAMLIRTLLLPLAFVAAIGGSADGSGAVRITIDVEGTDQLRTTPFQRVP